MFHVRSAVFASRFRDLFADLLHSAARCFGRRFYGGVQAIADGAFGCECARVCCIGAVDNLSVGIFMSKAEDHVALQELTGKVEELIVGQLSVPWGVVDRGFLDARLLCEMGHWISL